MYNDHHNSFASFFEHRPQPRQWKLGGFGWRRSTTERFGDGGLQRQWLFNMDKRMLRYRIIDKKKFDKKFTIWSKIVIQWIMINPIMQILWCLHSNCGLVVTFEHLLMFLIRDNWFLKSYGVYRHHI